MRKVAALTVGVGLLAAACSSSSTIDTPDDSANPTPGDGTDPVVELDDTVIRFTAGLVPFNECDAFLDHVRTEAAARVGPFGLDNGGPIFLGDDIAVLEEGAADLDTADSAAVTESTAAQGGSDASVVEGTNVQVAGVDEADIIKTDGDRIVTITNNRLTVVDRSGPEPIVAGSVELPLGWAIEMFLVDDRVVVFGGGETDFGPIPVEPLAETTDEALIDSELGYFGEQAVITEVDLSSGAPVLGGRLSVEGRYVSSRLIDGTARVVLSSPPSQLPFVYPAGPAGEDRAEEANREIVAESTLDDWLPNYELTTPDGSIREGQLVACDRLHRPQEFGGFDLLSVMTLDLTQPLANGDTTGLLAAGETVYASTTGLYVATTVWPDESILAELGPNEQQSIDDAFETAIHKFDITGTGTALYLASGSVKGTILNQFAMDEYQDHLRVATTSGSPWFGTQDRSESFVTVLEQNGESLEAIGSVGDLGRGEQIFAVRFLGDTAYVVTFRQVDPFYVLDLSDPANPVVTGELKIPGFSSYLHPIGDDLVLGVGSNATDEGFTTGAKVSLFSAADPTNPVELAVWTLDDAWSDVGWDHRAFRWIDDLDLAVIPMTAWQQNFAGALVLEVDRDAATITEVARISHEQDTQQQSACDTVQPQQQNDGEFFAEPGMEIRACGQGESPDSPGYFCEGPIPLDDFDAYWGFALPDTVDPADDVYVCWNELGVDPIQRSVRIDDELWTMTWTSVQENSLIDFSAGAQLPIS